MMPNDAALERVAVVGAGLVGIGWAIVFARAGLSVSLFDSDTSRLDAAKADAALKLKDMERCGLVEAVEPIVDRISPCRSLDEAVGAADYVQESVFEAVDVKRAACERIACAMPYHAIVGSSSSGIRPSEFTEGLRRRERFFVVHPVNPPHLVPLVEIVPAPWSNPELVPVLRAFLERVGQRPVVLQRELQGFILNRLQGALLNEAWALYADGYASLADIDRTVSEGLGHRWSFMGPFETIDLNAPGGIEDYCSRLGALYQDIALSRRAPRPWSAEIIAKASMERRAELPESQLESRQAWRDRTLMSFRRWRQSGAVD